MALISVTKTYKDGDVLLEADLDGIKSSIENFVNVTRLNDDNLQNDGITGSDKLVDASVSQAKMATNSISTAKVVDGAITTAKLADTSVTTAKITDANVTTAKIADANITTAKIADSNVTAVKLATDSVTEDKITAGAVTEAKIGSNAVTTAKINDAAVTIAKQASVATLATNFSGSATGTTTLTLVSSRTLTQAAGRPLRIVITSYEASSASSITSGGSGNRVLRFGSYALVRLGASHTFYNTTLTANTPWVFVIASPGPGTYNLYIDTGVSESVTVTNVNILIEELP